MQRYFLPELCSVEKPDRYVFFGFWEMKTNCNFVFLNKTMRIYFFIFLWLTTLFSHADGDSYYRFSATSEYAFRYNSQGISESDKYFIREIARINFLNLYTTSYTIEYVEELSLKPGSSGSTEIESTIRPTSVKGDITYKKFQLEDVLTPAYCNYHLNVFEGNSLVETIEYKNVKPGKKQTETLQLPLNTGSDFRLEISGIEFGYSETNKKTFSERISQINEYLAFVELSNWFTVKVSLINPDSKQRLLSTFLEIYDLERFCSNLNNQAWAIRKNIPESYEKTLKRNTKKLRADLRRLHTIFTGNLDTLTFDPGLKEYEYAAEMLINIQQAYLKAVEKTHYYYEPVYLRMATFFSHPENWKDLSEKIDRRFPAVPELATSNVLASCFYQAYVRTADRLISGENFNEALLMLRNAESLCEAESGLDCDLDIYHRLSRSTYGIYDSYLRIAHSAMESGKPDMAFQYLMQALKFQQDNSRFIIMQGDVDNALEELAWNYFSLGREYLNNENQAEAFHHLSRSKTIYKELGIETYLGVIEKKIADINFLQNEMIIPEQTESN